MTRKKPVIKEIKKVSVPGKRVYVGAQDIKPFRRGYGMAVLTTPKGVLSDSEAKKKGVGGEVICSIW